MKTNVTVRNITGAFVGGMTGILTCYYVGLTFMPLGCLVGVVLGFWHDRLLSDYGQYLAAARQFASRCRQESGKWLANAASYIKSPMDHLRQLWARIPTEWGIGRHLIRFFSWCVSLPLLFVAWLRKHPMNRANTITVLMTPVILLALWKLGYFSAAFRGEYSIMSMSKGDSSTFREFIGIGLFISTMFLFFTPVILLSVRSDTAGFYRSYSRYSRYGAIGWVLFELKNSIASFAYAFIATELLLSALAIIVGTLFASIALGAAIIMTIIIPARFFWKCVQLPGHWFCFLVTVLTTLVAWLMMHSYITNPEIAWTLALTNGVVAAAISEGLRRAYAFVVSRWDWAYELVHLRGLIDEPEDIIGFVFKSFGQPVTQFCIAGWQRIEPRLPRIRLNPEGFWLTG